jgi:hypothetical protein
MLFFSKVSAEMKPSGVQATPVFGDKEETGAEAKKEAAVLKHYLGVGEEDTAATKEENLTAYTTFCSKDSQFPEGKKGKCRCSKITSIQNYSKILGSIRSSACR